EPGAGSDAASLVTKATATASGWSLTGSKVFITQGTVAGTYVVVARTDDPGPGEQRSAGISAFVVDGASQGLERGSPEHKLGLRSSDTTPLTFIDLHVEADQLLGARGKAFDDVTEVLCGGRIGIGAMGIGLGRAALETAARYALERNQFGKARSEERRVGKECRSGCET